MAPLPFPSPFCFLPCPFLFISCASFLLLSVPFPSHPDTYLNHLFALIFSICVPFLLFFFSVFLFCFSFLFCLIRQSTTINEKHFKMKSATEQVQKARNGYVSSCEAAKRGGEAAEVAPKGRLISVASGAYCCFTTVPSGPHCYMHANDGLCKS